MRLFSFQKKYFVIKYKIFICAVEGGSRYGGNEERTFTFGSQKQG